MALNLEAKKAIVVDVAAKAKDASSAVAADYCGLSVEQMTALRKDARNAGVYLRVVRNTLARRALADTEFACMSEALVGPLVLAFSYEEPGAAAKLCREFAKENDAFEVKALSIGGKLLGAKDLNLVASIPNREEALTKLVVVMQAPITKMVRTLAEPHAKLVRLFAAIRDQKQQAA